MHQKSSLPAVKNKSTPFKLDFFSKKTYPNELIVTQNLESLNLKNLFLSLQKEILLLILESLDKRDICNLALVCKKLSKIAKDKFDTAPWPRVSFKNTFFTTNQVPQSGVKKIIPYKDYYLCLLENNSLHIFSKELQHLYELKKSERSITAITQIGPHLCTGHDNGSILIWNLKEKISKQIIKYPKRINLLIAENPHQFFVNLGDEIIWRFNIKTFKSKIFLKQENSINLIANVKDFLYTSVKDDGIYQWNKNTNEHRLLYPTRNKIINLQVYENLLIIHDINQALFIFDIKNKQTALLEDYPWPIKSLSLFNEGYLAVGYLDGVIRFWNLKEYKLAHRLDTGIHPNTLTITQDNDLLLASNTNILYQRCFDEARIDKFFSSCNMKQV